MTLTVRVKYLQEIIPLINWETRTFSEPVLALLIFSTMALFPLILFPSTPSMWVAGMTFGYGIGFLLSIAGVAVGVSLPFFIGSRFLHKVQVTNLYLCTIGDTLVSFHLSHLVTSVFI